MIKYFFLSFLSLCLINTSTLLAYELPQTNDDKINKSPLVIIYDKTHDLEKFRILSNPYPDHTDPKIVYFNDKLPPRDGLENLKVSGSAQFSEKGLDEILKRIDQKSIILFDLREEPHGFINKLPVSWIHKNGQWPNLDESPKEIEDEEKDLLKLALKEKDISIYKIIKNRSEDDEIFNDEFKSSKVKVENISTERNLSAKLGLAYFRIPVTDHEKPKDNDVDAFLTYYLSRPEAAWTHIHCRGGKGRTSTFLTLVDMIHNAKIVSFEDIMDRQMLISQINLIVPKSILQKKYKDEFFARLEFLKEFYTYCKENKDDFKTTWSKWKSLDNQKVNTSFE